MKWSEICIQTTNEAVEPIANILHETGASGLVIEDPADLTAARESVFGAIYDLNPDDFPEDGVRIKSYLPSERRLSDAIGKLKIAIEELKKYGIDIGKNEISISEVHEEDWATSWKKYYKPIQISDKITITPTWENYQPKTGDELIIELDPGMAFGTGSHPTTMLSIRALENYLKKDHVVLDVGSGSGVLSIASALLGAKEIHAFDLDEIAVKSTQINAELNNLDHKIVAKQNNLLDDVRLQADVIVSNILAEIIVKFTKEAWNNLKAGGLFITSGIIQDKKQLVLDHLQEQGFEILAVDELEDWVSIVAQKGL